MNDPEALYLSWLNDFTTLTAFAAHYGLTLNEANEIIRAEQVKRATDQPRTYGRDCDVATQGARLEITIGLANQATEHPDELARILRRLADHIQGGQLPNKLMDLNGNTVGNVVRIP